MSTLNYLDLELAILALSMVYKTSELIKPDEVFVIDVPKNVVTEKQYYHKLFLIHPSVETVFLEKFKEPGMPQMVAFSDAQRMEKEDVERVMKSRARIFCIATREVC